MENKRRTLKEMEISFEEYRANRGLYIHFNDKICWFYKPLQNSLVDLFDLNNRHVGDFYIKDAESICKEVFDCELTVLRVLYGK